MKTWKTITITTITTSALIIAGVFTYNYLQLPTTISNTTTSTSVSSSTESIENTDSSDNTNTVYPESNSTEQINTGHRAFQPTFKVECVNTKLDMYTVEHIPTGGKTKAITYEEAESFCKYMEEIAYGKETLSYTMDENYNSWKSNN